MNHIKKDRLFEIAERQAAAGGVLHRGRRRSPRRHRRHRRRRPRLPRLLVLRAALGPGADGRHQLGRCFAGNAALLGCCDVIIATENSNIGMGGPAMIEGGGLGVFRPDEVGPDVRAARERRRRHRREGRGRSRRRGEAVPLLLPGRRRRTGKRRPARAAIGIPENRLRVYDIRRVIDALADTDSVLELRRDWGHGMITALARIEGRPVGVIANNPAHLGGRPRRRGLRQGRALHAALRRLRPADRLPVRHAGHHGRPRDRGSTRLVRHAGRMFVPPAA